MSPFNRPSTSLEATPSARETFQIMLPVDPSSPTGPIPCSCQNR
jgi:hypothetical protein